jgi:hypothetical protein
MPARFKGASYARFGITRRPSTDRSPPRNGWSASIERLLAFNRNDCSASAGARRQFCRWADSGLWDVILEALAGSGVRDATLQMIDVKIIRAHHCAGGGKGGPRAMRSAVRAAAARLRSTPAPMLMVYRSASRSRPARSTMSPPIRP